MPLVPELYCADMEENVTFFVDLLGFEVRYSRPEEGFVYLERGEVELMLERIDAPGRKWIPAKLEPPLGRGVNFQCDVEDVTPLWERIRRERPECILLELERATYRCGARTIEQLQFVVTSPDGYLFRFCEETPRTLGGGA